MKITRPILFFFTFLFAVSMGVAQMDSTKVISQQKNKRPDLQTVLKMKMDYLKVNLVLTAEESNLFWDLYDSYVRDEFTIHERYHELREAKGVNVNFLKLDYKTLTDEQIIVLYDLKFQMKQDLLTLEESFYHKIKKVLTPFHISEYYRVEKEFKTACLSEQYDSKSSKKRSPVSSEKAVPVNVKESISPR